MAAKKTFISFRDLTAEEIDCRVVNVSKEGVKILLCCDPRTAMKILDETVGAEHWQSHHYAVTESAYCQVGINVNFKDDNLEPAFTWKSDGAGKRFEGDVKGEASESFLRACTQWGIGRELYTSPNIFVRGATVELVKGSYQTPDRFRVSELKVENKQIKSLSIERAYRAEDGKAAVEVCFTYPKT